MSNSSNQNPGCLASILRLFGGQANRSYPAFQIEGLEAPDVPEAFPYRVRDDFLSPTELSFYHVLRTVIGNRAIICPKVGLAEIFFVTRPHENYAYRSRIVQKHVDFVLCAPKTMQPILGIELDDSSHARADRQERDAFVNKAFEAANLPLLRLPAKRMYNTHELADELAKYLGEGTPQPKAAPVEPMKEISQQEPANGFPFCPKCGVPMVVRTVAKGDHQGKQFYGCSNYPRCREMLPLKK